METLEPLLCSIPEGARALGLGRSKIYELIGSGQIETVTIGRRRLIRVASIKSLAQAEAA
jgi:excisionase family DNA binding protein